jgi:enoyl-CoA hydratase/carnithine racemase
MRDYADGALRLELGAAEAWLTLNRPDKRNAVTSAMWAALPSLLQEVEASRSRVLILRGAGPHFAAGADIGEFETVFADRRAAGLYAAQMTRALDALARLDRPTIAMVSGACVGAGLGLALACDLRMASDEAIFAVTPAKLGLLYSLGDTKRLVDPVGPSVARDLLYTGRKMTAAEAREAGLINDLVDSRHLEAAVMAKAQSIAANSQWSVRKAKAVIAMVLDGVAADTEETRTWFIDAIDGDDYREGLAAFLHKRPPAFR